VFDNQVVNLSTATGNERKFIFTHSSTVQRYEVGGPKNGLQIGTETTTTTYDSFGNATQVVTSLTDNDATSPYAGLQWTSTTDVTITPDASANWCLTQPTRVVVTKTAPNGPIATRSIARRTDFTPDYVNCRPTQVDIEPSSSTYHVTQVPGYDSFGNVNAVTTTGAGMAARGTASNWGATGQFPMSFTNALGQQTLFDYDFNFGGRTSVTDPNNVTTSWHYDAFGRRDTETRPDGTHTAWSYSDCTSSGGCLIGNHAITLGVTEYNGNNNVLTDSTVFFDTLGRALVAKSRQLDGSYRRDQVQYDTFGRVSKSYMPCTWSALATPCPYTATRSFDALGRLTQLARAVSSVDSTVQTTTIQYAGRATTSVDAQGKSNLQIDTVAGTIGRIRDHDGYGQDFISDPFGNLLNVVDSDGNTLFTATYDYGIGAFQVDATDADLDVSPASGQHRHYVYNALGELTNWSDAKGQTFSQTYDALSRPRVRTEPDLVTTWTWDHSINNDRHSIGQLMDVSATSALGTYAEAYAFDPLARPSSTAVTIPTQGTYTYENAYDPNTGLLDTLTYPESTSSYRLKLKYAYQNGILQSVSDSNAPSTVFWTANAVNARGQVTQETLGNGVVTNRVIDALTGWMTMQTSGVAGGNAFQNDGFLFDRVGNVTQRQNTNAGLT
jgi:YD repeat-containing protein